VLELTEEALDEIALAVDATVHGTVNQALAGRWDMGFGSTGSDQVEECVGIIATISDDVPAFETGEQKRCSAQVMLLSSGQHQPHWQTILID
jgi:hypothetical protein